MERWGSFFTCFSSGLPAEFLSHSKASQSKHSHFLFAQGTKRWDWKSLEALLMMTSKQTHLSHNILFHTPYARQNCECRRRHCHQHCRIVHPVWLHSSFFRGTNVQISWVSFHRNFLTNMKIYIQVHSFLFPLPHLPCPLFGCLLLLISPPFLLSLSSAGVCYLVKGWGSGSVA